MWTPVKISKGKLKQPKYSRIRNFLDPAIHSVEIWDKDNSKPGRERRPHEKNKDIERQKRKGFTKLLFQRYSAGVIFIDDDEFSSTFILAKNPYCSVLSLKLVKRALRQ